MSLRVTILGCGSSGGVPRIGGDWGACDPHEPKNRRRRCSILVERFSKGDGEGEGEATRVLVDTSPDLYDQLFGKNIDWLDGVLYTHHHADQTHGINDLRAFFINRWRSIDVYMDKATADIMTKRFSYCFQAIEGSGYMEFLKLHELQVGQESSISGPGGDITFLPFLLHHGSVDALGFRFGPVAYAPDVVGVPDQSFDALKGVECWIVDTLRYQPHPTHAHLDMALKWIKRVQPKRSVLTNMHIDLDYQTLKRELPQGIEPAYDNMVLDFPNCV